MKRLIAWALISVMILAGIPTVSFAASNNFYLIEDSDKRMLTREELWNWQYEAVGYIYNEIFARHGRPFRTGEKYDVYFRNQEWYHVNQDYRYGLLNNVEQYNERLAHDVLHEMRQAKTTNPFGRPLPTSNDEAYLNDVISFRSYELKRNQKLAVYSGPGDFYLRGAKGKASVSTNGAVSIAGMEDGWILVEYATSGGAMRVGYIQASKLKDKVRPDGLDFLYESGSTTARCSLTDDPDGLCEALMTLQAGKPVTLLCAYTSMYGEKWAYVEAESDQGPVRGFVPADRVTGSVEVFEEYDWDDEEVQADGH